MPPTLDDLKCQCPTLCRIPSLLTLVCRRLRFGFLPRLQFDNRCAAWASSPEAHVLVG